MRYLADVTTLALDEAKCIGCGMCEHVCPHAVFSVADGKAAMADRNACMECGACARNCLGDAISVRAGVGCAWAVLLSRGRTDGMICCGPEEPSCCG